MNVEEYNAQVAAGMLEAKLQDLVIGLATTLGWLTYHTHDSRRSQAGFPDLCMVRGERVVFAELKSMKGRVRLDQNVWIDALYHSSAEVYLWRPDAYLRGEVESVLR